MKTKELKSYRALPRRQAGIELSKGQVMLEAVVALTIMTIGMLGIFTILSSSIAANRASTNKEIAVNLAAEGIEVVKSIIDENHLDDNPLTAFNDGLNNCGGGCKFQYNSDGVESGPLGELLKFNPTTKLYSYDTIPQGSVNTIFKRVITINGSGSPTNRLDVISTVSWTERNNKQFSVVLEDRFYDWRP